MRILYVSFWYAPEMGAPAARAAELTRAWAEAGHQVSVLTGFPHYPHGHKREEDRGVLMRREVVDGVEVLRTYVFAARNAGRLRRALGYVSFLTSSLALGSLRLDRPDVIVATTPQIFVGLVGTWLRTRFRCPLVLEVRDLWPESIIAAGALPPGSAVAGAVGRLSRYLYETADHVVAVGPGYRSGILRASSVPAERVSVLTNGADLRRFDPLRHSRSAARRSLGLRDEDFVVLYLGNHGMCHALERVLEAAERLAAYADVRFVFVGDGAERPKLVALARQRGLDNVRLDPPCPRADVNRYYAAANVCLAPLRRAALFSEVIPSKIFEIMAMARPVLLSVDGDARAIVSGAGAGVYVPAEDVPGMCEAILALRADPAACEDMGQRGRALVEQRFDRDRIATDYLALLRAVADGEPAELSSRRGRSAGPAGCA